MTRGRLAGTARLKGHYRLDAVRAHLPRKAAIGRRAVAHYRKAAARTSSVPERKLSRDPRRAMA